MTNDDIALFERYRPLAEAVIRRAVSGNSIDAEAARNAGLAGLWLAVRRLKPGRRGIAAYFRQRVAGAIVDHWRRELRSRSGRCHRFLSLQDDLAAKGGCDPGDRLERRDLLSHLRSGLSWPQRLTVVLHWFEGLTVTEIAALLSTPKATIHSRINTAMRSMAVRAGVFRRHRHH